jgi:hypothetical protein
MLDVAEDWMLDEDKTFDPTERAFGNFSGVEVSRVEEMFSLSKTGYNDEDLEWKKFLEYVEDGDEVNYYQKEAIKGNIKRGNEHMDPERVTIGTIHSSKGKEAETVILALDTTTTIAENMRQDTRDDPSKVISDPERRVYYVGMTRASQKLVLAEGVVDPEMTLSLHNLLDGSGAPSASSDSWDTQLEGTGNTRVWGEGESGEDD